MIHFNNIRYYTGSFNQFTDYIFQLLENNPFKKIIITHINLRNYFFLNKDLKLKEEINKDCTVVFDGIGLKIGFWLKGFGLLPDLNGTDLFPLIMEKISDSGLGVFLLGSYDNNISKAASNIKKSYPKINIQGYHHGYFSKAEEMDIVDTINQSKSEVLLIGMGFPMQEQFVLKYKDKLNLLLVWNIGGLFDIISEQKPRSPLILRKLRLEWLFRFLLEPRRMLHRNTVCAFWSLFHIILQKKY